MRHHFSSPRRRSKKLTRQCSIKFTPGRRLYTKTQTQTHIQHPFCDIQCVWIEDMIKVLCLICICDWCVWRMFPYQQQPNCPCRRCVSPRRRFWTTVQTSIRTQKVFIKCLGRRDQFLYANFCVCSLFHIHFFISFIHWIVWGCEGLAGVRATTTIGHK